MKQEFIPYEQALELKEMGFDEVCMGGYDLEDDSLYIGYVSNDGIQYNPEHYTPAPLYSQSFRWLLEKHNLYGIIIPTVTMTWTFKTITVVIGMVEVPPYNHVEAYDYSSREEAELECLKKLIDVVKNK
jgi:hypothetical protein